MHANENLTRADVMLQPPAGTEPTSPTEPLVLLVFHSSRYEGTSVCDSEDSFHLFVSILGIILDSTRRIFDRTGFILLPDSER